MTYEESTILMQAGYIRDCQKWESRCKGCKHLTPATWYCGNREGRTYSCGHPERQGGFSDPRPYGCEGHYYEK